MRKLYPALLASAIPFCITAQEVLWQKDVKSSTQDFLSGITATTDRQFLVSGSAIQAPRATAAGPGATQQNNGYDFHVIKLNQQGQQTFEKHFAGNGHDFLTAATPTQEGGFLLAGTTFSTEGTDKKDVSHGGSDIWVIKITDQGNEEWQATLGRATDEEARSVVQSTDLGYFVAGNAQNAEGGFGSKDAWILKLDKEGKVVGEAYIGGRGLDEVERVIPTRDGGALAAIYSRSSEVLGGTARIEKREPASRPAQEGQAAPSTDANKTVEAEKPMKKEDRLETVPVGFYPKASPNHGEGDYWIVKLDKTGKVEWQRSFGGKEDDHIRALSNTDTGYVIAGESRSPSSGNKLTNIKEGTDLWLVSLKPDGAEQWQKSYSFGNRDVLMSLNTVWTKEGRTKGYLIGGYTQAEGRTQKDDETFWMLYLDAKGDEVWRKHVEGGGRKKEERLVDAQLNADGSYILAGTSAQELGKENWKILMLGDRQVRDLVERQAFAVYPNPASEYCYVEIGEEFSEATISLYDMAGKLIQSSKTKNAVNKIDTAALPQGTYTINATTENNKFNAKIIKK